MASLFKISRYAVIATIALVLAALAVWYFFLRNQQNTIEQTDAARGAGIVQSFTGVVGSTYENIRAALGGGTGNATSSGALPRLAHVGNAPMSGIGFVTDGTSTELRLVERATGNILSVSPEDGTLRRLTNTLVSGTFETVMMNKGRVIVRSVDDAGTLMTTVGTIASSSAETGPLAQRALPNGIRSIAASPSGDEVFYILDTSGGAVGIKAAWDGTNPKQIFSSAVSGWHSYWLADGRIILVQNASDGIPGYAYVIEKSGVVSPLLRNIPGLTALPHPTSHALLYGQSNGGLALYAQISDTATPILLPVRTVADKCVWNPTPELIAFCAVPQSTPPPDFLDQWYRGEVHTADAWWRVDVSAGTAELLYAPGNDVFDVVDPTIDAGGNYIAFTNAIDDSPRLLRVQQ